MINYDLQKIRAIIFDLDGVLSKSTISLGVDGTPLRTVNIKDGYAIQLAQKKGLRVVILSGGQGENIRRRYEYLGVTDIYLRSAIKVETYESFCKKYNIADEEVLYMGDDIPDLPMLRRVGCPCCPADACPEVKAASLYISQRNGGHGCVRDVLEQVMRVQGTWMSDAEAFGW